MLSIDALNLKRNGAIICLDLKMCALRRKITKSANAIETSDVEEEK